MMIGDRIRQARIASGMTQDDVVDALAAEGVSLTKAGLSKYERGGSTPKASVLRALGRVLGVDSSYFLEEPDFEMRWLAFRKASRLGKSKQQRVKALAESQLEVFLTLRHALEPMASEAKLPPRAPVREPEVAERAAESLRHCWLLGDQPIESVTAAIEDGGGVVVHAGGDQDLFDGLSGWANETVPVVVVSSAVSDDRRRFSLAHELGHLFMDVGEVDKKTEEKLAHRFAAAFLVTAATARRELGTKRRHLDVRELAMLKRKHGLSMQAWIFRAADLGIIEQSHARTLFAEMSARGWRREEPADFHGHERPQKLRQLTIRALAEGLLTHLQAERICPGVTRNVDEKELVGPLDARSFLRMPKGERDRLVQQAAALVADEYEDGGGLSGLESLCEEDHFDQSIDA
jgi:Zn-dependent peptidase ImmA (M78 family)/transcriptional regulator with XRE-family HTH domain